ncbi:MAG: lipocalin family protein [Bacteroidota bacterium]
MKQLILCMALAFTHFTECNQPDKYAKTSLIVGKWKHIKDDVLTFNAAGKAIMMDNPDYSKSDNYFQFNADGTGVANIAVNDGSGKYNAVPFEYTLKNTVLVLKYKESSETDQVTTLTSKSLVLHAEYSKKDDDGKLISTQKVDLYFSK